jgi:Altronate dehydratase
MQNIIKINKEDNVAVALYPLECGLAIELEDQNTVTLLEDIPQGHKFAVKPIKVGEDVTKYGHAIGAAKEDIKAGQWVHIQNVRTKLDEEKEYAYEPVEKVKEEAQGKVDIASEILYFDGFRRQNGKAGVRNEIWVVPTVGCVNNVAQSIVKRAEHVVQGTIEELVSFPHPYGCSQMGDDQESTRIILSDLINHPNAGAVLVLGLGCENSSIDVLKEYIGEYDPERVKFLVAQESEDEISAGVALVEELAKFAGTFKREKIPAKELIIGTKCGGSDGLSGITANPAVGGFSDLLIAQGGTTILTEVPEMFGAEDILMNRCADEVLYEKTVALINDFKDYFTSHNQTVYENPSPGNKAGGITTLEDKSLGCTQKSGSAVVKGVLDYGEAVKERGLNLLSAPGNDLVAATALAASGAQIVLFTTGRGTPFASPVPTVKISSNSKLAGAKENWIDFNAGKGVEGTSMEELSKELLEFVLDIASGKKTKAELSGFHDMAIFKHGVTL